MSNYTKYCEYIANLETQILEVEKGCNASQEVLNSLYNELYKARIVLSKGKDYINDYLQYTTIQYNSYGGKTTNV